MISSFSIPGRPHVWKRKATATDQFGKLIRVTSKPQRLLKRQIAMLGIAGRPRYWRKGKRYALAVRVVLPHLGGEGDCDNYGKLIMDALQQILWDNDKQVSVLLVTKEVGDEPRTDVTTLALDDNRLGPFLERAREFVNQWRRRDD